MDPNIVRITVGRTVDLGNYESIRFELTAEVRAGETWQDTMDALKAVAEEEDRLLREEHGRPPRRPTKLINAAELKAKVQGKAQPEPQKAKAVPAASPAPPKSPVQPVKLDRTEFRNDPKIKSAVAAFARSQGLPLPKPT